MVISIVIRKPASSVFLGIILKTYLPKTVVMNGLFTTVLLSLDKVMAYC